MNTRMEKLMQAVKGMEAALVTTPVNRFYFLGLDTGDAGTLLILPQKSYFIIDSRYIEIAERTVTSAEVVLQDKTPEQVREILTSHGVKRLHMENKETLSLADSVRGAIGGIALDTSAVLSDAIDALRAIKTPEELASIRKAQKITDDCLAYILPKLKPGVREIDAALDMEMYMRSHGAGKLAFDTILVSGANGSLPHGVPSEKTIEDGDFITMDFGANVDGYCTDMTRTVAVGHVSDEQKKVYDTVLKAQLAACDAAKAGMRGCEVDKIARDIIAQAGYGQYFGHGLGHAVGIEIHENPRYSPTCDTVVQAGMVMTIEPGIYLPGQFGVRIEDTVFVGENSVEPIAKSDKSLIIL